jgi:hypothetical protein
MRVYRILSARQASYGIAIDMSPFPSIETLRTSWETIRESFGDYTLSVEYGRAGFVVEELPEDASDEQRFDALARLENLGTTWAQQQAMHPEDERFETMEEADHQRQHDPDLIAEEGI